MRKLFSRRRVVIISCLVAFGIAIIFLFKFFSLNRFLADVTNSNGLFTTQTMSVKLSDIAAKTANFSYENKTLKLHKASDERTLPYYFPNLTFTTEANTRTYQLSALPSTIAKTGTTPFLVEIFVRERITSDDFDLFFSGDGQTPQMLNCDDQLGGGWFYCQSGTEISTSHDFSKAKLLLVAKGLNFNDITEFRPYISNILIQSPYDDNAESTQILQAPNTANGGIFWQNLRLERPANVPDGANIEATVCLDGNSDSCQTLNLLNDKTHFSNFELGGRKINLKLRMSHDSSHNITPEIFGDNILVDLVSTPLVNGTVRFGSTPLADATITINQRDRVVGNATSDSQGRYSVVLRDSNIASGSFEIIATPTNQTEKNNRINISGAGTYTSNFDFRNSQTIVSGTVQIGNAPSSIPSNLVSVVLDNNRTVFASSDGRFTFPIVSSDENTHTIVAKISAQSLRDPSVPVTLADLVTNSISFKYSELRTRPLNLVFSQGWIYGNVTGYGAGSDGSNTFVDATVDNIAVRSSSFRSNRAYAILVPFGALPIQSTIKVVGRGESAGDFKSFSIINGWYKHRVDLNLQLKKFTIIVTDMEGRPLDDSKSTTVEFLRLDKATNRSNGNRSFAVRDLDSNRVHIPGQYITSLAVADASSFGAKYKLNVRRTGLRVAEVNSESLVVETTPSGCGRNDRCLISTFENTRTSTITVKMRPSN